MHLQELFLVLSLCVYNSINFSYSNKRKEITSVTGSIGQLPCYVDTGDDVAMILWFKESSGTPIYSYDGRIEGEAVKHLPVRNEFGLRLHFRVPSRTSLSPSTRPPALLIRNLKASDSGVYRCRIDYKNSPTTNNLIRLNVIQPPTRLEIQVIADSQPISDQESSRASNPGLQSTDITYMGPYIEGQNVSIVCTAFGGLPFPEVFWYRNGSVVDYSYAVAGNDSVANELRISVLDRSHSHDLFTCQASNNNETKPISHRVNFEVYSRVKHIEVEVPDQMTAGVDYNLTCRTQGAYPAVKLEFWKLQKRIGGRFQSKSDEESHGIYVIPFNPEPEDNEALVTCKAENPWIPQSFMEAGRKLNILYSPVAVLRFGSSKRTNFSEGESVLLECHSKGNPPLNTITWFHQGKELLDNVSAGVHLNGMTLVIRYLTHLSVGNYACEASNYIGKGRSNSLNIQLNISPKCSSTKEKVIPLAVGESRHLNCSIFAWPPDLNFYWTLNRSGSILPLSSIGQIIKLNLSEEESSGSYNPFEVKMPSRLDSKNSSFTPLLPLQVQGNFDREAMEIRRKSRGRDVEFDRIFHQSLLPYQVKSESDYGLVGCWAQNSYAKQIFPCLFRIVDADLGKHSQITPEEGTNPGNKGHKGSSGKGEEGEEGNALASKLYPTYRLILIGLLIFIALLSLLVTSLLLLYVRRRRIATAL